MDGELGAVIVFVIFLTWLGYYLGTKNRNILLGLIGSLGWIIFLVYSRNATTPVFGFAEGSFGDECIVYICYLMMIIIPLSVLIRIRTEEGFASKGYDVSPDGQVVGSKNPPTIGKRSVMDMDESEYKAYIRAKANNRR